MTKATVSAGPLLVLAFFASVAGAGGVEIRHDAVACVAADRYARISTAAVPPAGVASAELQFREGPTDGWYSVRMEAEGERWSAVLPKPIRSLGRFEYRIVLTDRNLEVTETKAIGVTVAAEAAACAGGPEDSTAVSSPIVIRVPAGAPPMPPVPGGFSPAGVVAAQEAPQRGPWKAKWLTAAGIAGGVAAAAIVGTSSGGFEQETDVVTVDIDSTRSSGRTLSLSFPDTILRMRVSGGLGTPLTLVWRLMMHSPEHGAVCVTARGVVSLEPAPRPISVDLAPEPLEVSPACGNRFAVDTGQVTVTRDGQVLFDGTVSLQFQFRP